MEVVRAMAKVKADIMSDAVRMEERGNRRSHVGFWSPAAGSAEKAPSEVGAPFIKSVELRSRPAAHFYVLLYAKSTIPNARHDSRAIF
jgi:hypothetical protein